MTEEQSTEEEIREKIEAEAMGANLVKGGGNSLPI